MNLFALPHGLTPSMTRAVDWYQAAGREEGTIALIAFSGASGRDHAADARAPNLGLFLARLAINDAPLRCDAVERAGVGQVRTRYRAIVRRWGRIAGCLVASPDGALLDLFSQRD